MLVKDGLRPEMEHNKNLHYQRSFIQRLKQYGVRVKAYGDTGIRVGDIIKLALPDISGVTESPKPAEIFSENYQKEHGFIKVDIDAEGAKIKLKDGEDDAEIKLDKNGLTIQ